MAKKKSRRRKEAPSGRRRTTTSGAASLVIPIVVGVVVLVIVAGAIVLNESRLSPATGGVGTDSALVSTAQPLATGSIPFPRVPRIGLEDAKEKLESGQALLVDVRSKAAYDKAHAAGAMSIPEDEIKARAGELPRDIELVLY
jgi:hypothetical protein